MCTVTIVRTKHGVRMAVNRDESRARPEALPPQVRQYDSRRAIFPVDPVGGGTWVAVNDAGVAFTLLNSHPAWAFVPAELQPPPSGIVLPEAAAGARADLPGAARVPGIATLASRGAIIPALLGRSSLESALVAALNLDVRCYQPFRLLIVDEVECVELAWNGRNLRLRERGALNQPRMFTSSSLGDEVVSGPRRQLFQQLFGAPEAPDACRVHADSPPEDWISLQNAFHAHRWPECPHLSVHMSRDDARTVSFTVVELRPKEVILAYAATPEDPSPATISLAR